jgi:hypothetical protein
MKRMQKSQNCSRFVVFLVEIDVIVHDWEGDSPLLVVTKRRSLKKKLR